MRAKCFYLFYAKPKCEEYVLEVGDWKNLNKEIFIHDKTISRRYWNKMNNQDGK